MIQKIPLISPPNSNVEGIENELQSVNIFDGFINSNNYLYRRPGSELFTESISGNYISSLYYWEAENVIFAICQGNVYSIASDGTTTYKGTGLDWHNRASFAVTKIAGNDYLAMANGGRIYISIDNGNISAIPDENAPGNVSYICFANNRLVANNYNTDLFYWSNLNDVMTWDPLNYASAEGNPDAITYLTNFQNDIILFGGRSIEKFYITGVADSPFARRQGSQINIGTLSPRSVIYDEESNRFIFLNHQRSVVVYDGTNYTKISEPIDKLLYELTNISNITGDIIKINNKKFYLLTCVNDNKSYVFDLNNNTWYIWGTYDIHTGNYILPLWGTSVYVSEWGKNIGGSHNDGRIYEITDQAYDDNGTSIRTAIRTGFIHMGTNQTKTISRMMLKVKQNPSSNTKFIIAYRKDSEGSFDYNNKIKNINIGIGSLTPYIHTIFGFGTCRGIQFEIYVTENVPWVIGDCEISYEINRS